MKRIAFATLALLCSVLAFDCHGQNRPERVETTPDSTSIHRVPKPPNMALGLSGITADSLTYRQFSECTTLTLADDDSVQITDYTLSYFVDRDGEQVLYSISFTSNHILGETILQILDSGTPAVLVEEIYALKGLKRLKLGYRWFYFK